MYPSSILSTASATVFSPSPLKRSIALIVHDAVNAARGDSQLQRWSSLIGIITAIVGNVLISFALNIQRYAHIRLHKEREEQKELSKRSSRGSKNGYRAPANKVINTPSEADQEADPLTSSSEWEDSQAPSPSEHVGETSYLKSPYWWAGILLMTVGETGNFLAYGFAPASIVSPLGVVALISNCVIAPIMLKERFRWRDFWGVVVAVGGAVTVVLSAKQQEKKLGPHEVIGAITTLEFEIYMGVTIALIIVLAWASPRYGNRTILIDLGLVGLFGGYTALSTKGVASMLSSSLWKAFTTPITYALVLVLIGTAIMQVKYINKALQRFDSTQVIPVQFVMFTLSVIIGSAILYRDFEQTTPERTVKFVGGCLLTFFGVFLITSGRSRAGDEDSEEDSDEEEAEAIDLISHETGDAHYDDGIKYATFSRARNGAAHSSDEADDESISPDPSRRSSRVNFAPQQARPQTPKMHSNTSQPPSIRLTTPAEGSRTTSGEISPLLSNPWKTSQDDLSSVRHPGLSFTTSSPVLPSEAQTTSTDQQRPHHARSVTHSDPHTHPNLQQVPTPPHADPESLRPVTPARHSLTRGMIPAPFISPLSSSLSAVVAETLRRGVDAPSRRKSSFHRPRLNLRRTKSGGGHHIESEEGLATSPLKHTQSAADDRAVSAGANLSTSIGSDDGWGKSSRKRSMSNAIGDFFSFKRPKDGREDDEAGPSWGA